MALNVKLDALSRMIASLKTQEASCKFCGGNHISTDYQVGNPYGSSSKHVNIVSNFNRALKAICIPTLIIRDEGIIIIYLGEVKIN